MEASCPSPHTFLYASLPSGSSWVISLGNKPVIYFGRWRQDDGVEGLQLTPSHENTKITNNCWTTIDQKDWNLPKQISCIQGRRRSPSEMVGGAHSWYNQIPYPLGGWPTNCKITITEVLPQVWKFCAPHQAPQSAGLASGGAIRAFGFEGQQGLITRTPQD